MNKPFPAYRGTDSYGFVCYAHSDAEIVYRDMGALHDAGINLWYDEGIPVGASWRAEIADAIRGADRLLFFISPASLASNHCLREIDYALNNDIEIIPIYIEETSLPAELELALSRVQALMRNTDPIYMERLHQAFSETRGLSSFGAKARRNKFGTGTSIAAIVIAVIAIFAIFSSEILAPTEDQEAAVTSSPNAFNLYLQGLELLDRWDQEQNMDQAISLFTEAAELDPDFALAHARLAESLLMKYRLDGEVTILDEAAVHSARAFELNSGLAPVQLAMGRINAAQGNFDLALGALETASEIDPNDAKVSQAMGNLYEEMGRAEDADALFQRAIALDPANVVIIDAYANFLSRQGRSQEAIEQYQDAIQLAPDHYAVLVNLGSELFRTGRVPEAIIFWERANEIRPSYTAYSNLGVAYGQAGRTEESVAAYERALEIDGSSWLAWGNLGYLYSWMEGREDDAINAFNQAIQRGEAIRALNPRDSTINANLAMYYAKSGLAEPALRRIATAISLTPDSGQTYADAAEVYELLGQREQALEQVRIALELGYSRQQLQLNPELTDLLSAL